MGRPVMVAPKKPRKLGTKSKLSDKARTIIARTKAARAKLDAALVGFVDDDPTPVMIVDGPLRRTTGEQSEEPEAAALAPAERKKRSAKTAKARRKRSENAKARRASEAEMDAAIDSYFANGAIVAREVTEVLKPVMGPPTSLRGVKIG